MNEQRIRQQYPTVYDTSCAGIVRCKGKRDPDGNGPSHPGIVVTGADDQRLHAVGERRYWEDVADRVLFS